jgi:hypothetical protein
MSLTFVQILQNYESVLMAIFNLLLVTFVNQLEKCVPRTILGHQNGIHVPIVAKLRYHWSTFPMANLNENA